MSRASELLREIDQHLSPAPWIGDDDELYVQGEHSLYWEIGHAGGNQKLGPLRNALPQLIAVVEAAEHLASVQFTDSLTTPENWRRLNPALDALTATLLEEPKRDVDE